MIVFDVETSPLAREIVVAADPFPPFVPPGAFDPAAVKLGNIKDAAKIAEKVAEARAKHEALVAGADAKYAADKASHEQSLMDGAALHATTGKVLCIGYMQDVGEDGAAIDDGGDDNDERLILSNFWDLYGRCHADKTPMVGWNICGFDLPFIMRRSWRAGISVPKSVIERNRYWDGIFLDLMLVWQAGNYREYLGLASAAKYFGVGEKTGSGADFSRLWDQDRAAAVKYLLGDLELPWKIAGQMGQG